MFEPILRTRKMYEREFILKQGDLGFKEIAEVIKDHIRNYSDKNLMITQIKTLEWGQARVIEPKAVIWKDVIELEISSIEEPPFTGSIYDLKSKIRDKYLTKMVFVWKNITFWTGITITTISIFL